MTIRNTSSITYDCSTWVSQSEWARTTSLHWQNTINYSHCTSRHSPAVRNHSSHKHQSRSTTKSIRASIPTPSSPSGRWPANWKIQKVINSNNAHAVQHAQQIQCIEARSAIFTRPSWYSIHHQTIIHPINTNTVRVTNNRKHQTSTHLPWHESHRTLISASHVSKLTWMSNLKSKDRQPNSIWWLIHNRTRKHIHIRIYIK